MIRNVLATAWDVLLVGATVAVFGMVLWPLVVFTLMAGGPG